MPKMSNKAQAQVKPSPRAGGALQDKAGTPLQDKAETPLQDKAAESSIQSYRRSLERSRISNSRPDRPRTFTMYGREWDLYDEVFAPVYTRSTEVSAELLGLSWDGSHRPHRASLLEVGCGTGVLAVLSALSGCPRVVASDINPQAVANAASNAERHGMRHRVRAVHSDLFSGLDPDERFDTIFWHSNYVQAPESWEPSSAHDCAYVDPGYRAHRGYLTEAPYRTAPGGSALLHFSSRGDLAALHRIAEECGRELRLLRKVTVHEGEYGDDIIDHLLLEIVPLL